MRLSKHNSCDVKHKVFTLILVCEEYEEVTNCSLLVISTQLGLLIIKIHNTLLQ